MTQDIPIMPHEVFDPDEDIEFDDEKNFKEKDDWDEPWNDACSICCKDPGTCDKKPDFQDY